MGSRAPVVQFCARVSGAGSKARVAVTPKLLVWLGLATETKAEEVLTLLPQLSERFGLRSVQQKQSVAPLHRPQSTELRGADVLLSS